MTFPCNNNDSSNNVDATCVEMNNHAVWLIQIGEYEQAIDMLRIALRESKQCIRATTSAVRCGQTAPTPTGGKLEQDPILLNNTQDAAHHESKINEYNHSATANDDQSGYYVYRHPIRAAPLPSLAQASAEINLHSYFTKVSGVVIFNLALAHQLIAEEIMNSTKAAQATPTSHFDLARALQLYQAAYKCLQQQACVDTKNTLMVGTIIANNVAVLYALLNQQDSARNMFQQLLPIVMYHGQAAYQQQHSVFNSSGMNNSSNKSTSNIMDGFIRNVTQALIFPPSKYGGCCCASAA